MSPEYLRKQAEVVAAAVISIGKPRSKAPAASITAR